MTADDRWKEKGNCRSVSPDVMFPERGGGAAQAKAVCADCPVITECLDYALTTHQTFGVWGGTSERERIRIRGGRRKLAPHGTRACYARGCRQLECCTASDNYQREQAWLRRQAEEAGATVAPTIALWTGQA